LQHAAQPAIEQWKSLYEAAASFKETRCWEWMTSGHIFGVQNPQTGEIGYCSILGNGGEVLGLAVYLGAEGLNAMLELFSGESEEDPAYTQHSLLLSFDSRDELYPQELKQIKELGLKFRGANAWPTFRLYEPGFVPWPALTAEHVEFLTVALYQAIEVALSCRKDPDALFHEDELTFFAKMASRSVEGEVVWSEQWIQPEYPKEKMPQTADPINELRIAKAKKAAKGSGAVWEIDCFFAPMPINEGGRPFFPKMYLIVDQSSGQILTYGLCEKAELPNELAEKFLTVIEQLKFIPGELWAADEEAFVYITQLIDAFGLQAYVTSELPALEEARESLMGYFEAGMR